VAFLLAVRVLEQLSEFFASVTHVTHCVFHRARWREGNFQQQASYAASESQPHFPEPFPEPLREAAPIRAPIATQAAGEMFYKLLLGLLVPPGGLRHG
jgi:hypothetical protein